MRAFFSAFCWLYYVCDVAECDGRRKDCLHYRGRP